jgi:hypothetical protein
VSLGLLEIVIELDEKYFMAVTIFCMMPFLEKFYKIKFENDE